MAQNGPSPTTLDRTTVLVVEADDAVLNSLQFSLEVEGFAVRLYQRPDAILTEDAFPARVCLLIEYRLPQLNGLALLALLRGRGVNAPAVLMTGHADAALRQAAKEAGAGLIEKPYLNDSVADAIRRAMA